VQSEFLFQKIESKKNCTNMYNISDNFYFSDINISDKSITRVILQFPHLLLIKRQFLLNTQINHKNLQSIQVKLR
jgi:hypothetical protein